MWNTCAPEHQNPKPPFGRTPGLRAECWQGSIGPAMFSTKTRVKPKGGVRPTISQFDGLQGLPASIWLHLLSPQAGSQKEAEEVQTKMAAPQTKTSQRSTTAHARHTNIILHHIQNFPVMKVSTAQQRITHPKKTCHCKFPHQCVNPANHENLKPPQLVQ